MTNMAGFIFIVPVLVGAVAALCVGAVLRFKQ